MKGLQIISSSDPYHDSSWKQTNIPPAPNDSYNPLIKNYGDGNKAIRKKRVKERED